MRSILTCIALAGAMILFISVPARSETEQHPGGSASDKIEVISQGRLVDLIGYLVPGKYTAFYFYADWCGPCRILKPKLEKFVEDSDKLVLRELDIINWENPLVTYYKLPSIPYFIIYGPDGEFVERGPGFSNELMKEISSPD